MSKKKAKRQQGTSIEWSTHIHLGPHEMIKDLEINRRLVLKHVESGKYSIDMTVTFTL